MSFLSSSKSKAEKPKKEKKKPKRLDVYALILLLSWILLVAACILTYLDIASYNK